MTSIDKETLKDTAKFAVQRFINIPSNIKVDYVANPFISESCEIYRCYWSNDKYVNEKIPHYYGTVDISTSSDIDDYDIKTVEIFISDIDQYKIEERKLNKKIVRKMLSE